MAFKIFFFFRATTNAKVKETVALELSYVNSSLQLLKEELEDLNSNVEVYQTERSGHGRATAPFRVRRLKPPLFPLHSEAAKAPMIPLGLKETKEADLAAPIQVKTPPPRLPFARWDDSRRSPSFRAVSPRRTSSASTTERTARSIARRSES